MNKSIFKNLLEKQIPIAWIAGVRLHRWSEESVSTKVKLSFLNQNPFASMFWAVQGMAAEFSSGFLLAQKIKETEQSISMLIVGIQSTYTKKAVGKIIFTCEDGQKIKAAVDEAIETKQGVVLKVKSIGTDEAGDVVSTFEFTWSLKVKA